MNIVSTLSLFLYTSQAELTTVPEIEDDPASLPPPLMASPIQPTKPTAIIEEAEEERANEVEQLDILGNHSGCHFCFNKAFCRY